MLKEIKRIPRACMLFLSTVLIGFRIAMTHIREGDELEIELEYGGKNV